MEVKNKDEEFLFLRIISWRKNLIPLLLLKSVFRLIRKEQLLTNSMNELGFNGQDTLACIGMYATIFKFKQWCD